MSDEQEFIFCECGKSECPEAQTLLKAAIDRLPKTVTLFYLCQGDWLSEDQVKRIFDGEADEVADQIYDCQNENETYEYELDEILSSEEKECLYAHDLVNDLTCEIQERDESDPFGELLRVTPDIGMAYDLGYEIESGSEASEAERVLEAESIIDFFGLDPSLKPEFERMLANASEGEDLRLTWRGDVGEVVTALLLGEEPQDHFITWRGAVYIDTEYGNQVCVPGGLSVPFKRESLSLYSDLYIAEWRTAHVKLESEFDHYRNDLLAFFDYRSRLMA